MFYPRILSLLALVIMPFAFGQSSHPLDPEHIISPRIRVIIDNDFGGDPDGLFALAQHLLSPSVEVRAVIGSQHYSNGFYGLSGSSEHAREVAGELLQVMHLNGKIPLLTGPQSGLQDRQTPSESEAAHFIVKEAMRSDTNLPLFVVCGAGLTDIASAYLLEPKIANHLTLVWIGGPEHPDMAQPPPGPKRVEYNLGIDRIAAQVVFNDSGLRLWQIPRNAYRQAIVSYPELRYNLSGDKPLGPFLLDKLEDMLRRANRTLGEAYVLGDSPLMLMTALQTSWEVDPASSQYVELHAPNINDSGDYELNPQGRPIRVYNHLDTRLMFADFYAKVGLFSQQQ